MKTTGDGYLDACGLLCPLPVLKVRKRLLSMAPGALLEVLADDPMVVIDLPHFCAEAGHRLLAQEDRDGAHWFRIECAPGKFGSGKCGSGN